MKLNLRVSEKMSLEGEHGVVRLSPAGKTALGVGSGEQVRLATWAGDVILMRAGEARPEEFATGEGQSWVSQQVFNRVVGAELEEKMTLGCDPEFLFLTTQGKVHPARNWLPYEGPIGHDGPLAELRPLPATHEDGVVENLRQLIKGLPALVEKRYGDHGGLVPVGHSELQNLALGFHVHLGIPRVLSTYAAPKTAEFLRSFITVLDYFVGIPAMLLEDSSVRRLGNGQYGKPGDFRVSQNTIEYRTPGGFHLRHPDYARGILGLALCVGRDVFIRAQKQSKGWVQLDSCADFPYWQELYKLPTEREIHRAFLDPSKKAAIPLLPKLLKDLIGLGEFEEHANSIRRYFHLLARNKQYSPKLLDNW